MEVRYRYEEARIYKGEIFSVVGKRGAIEGRYEADRSYNLSGYGG